MVKRRAPECLLPKSFTGQFTIISVCIKDACIGQTVCFTASDHLRNSPPLFLDSCQLTVLIFTSLHLCIMARKRSLSVTSDSDVEALRTSMSRIQDIKNNVKKMRKELSRVREDRATILETSLDLSCHNTEVIISQSDEIRSLRSQLRNAREHVVTLESKLANSVELCSCIGQVSEEVEAHSGCKNEPEYFELGNDFITMECEWSGAWGGLFSRPPLLSCLSQAALGRLVISEDSALVVQWDSSHQHPRQSIKLFVDERIVYQKTVITAAPSIIPASIINFYSQHYPRSFVTIRASAEKALKTEK